MSNQVLRSVLQDKHEQLVTQYKANLADVCALQSILNDEVLPHVSQDFALEDADHAWAKEFISDTASIFRILRRHNFIRSFALESIRNTLIWRLHTLRPLSSSSSPPSPPLTLLHCLPPPICDPFGHPLVFLRWSEFLGPEQTMMDRLLISLERLRIHLRSLNCAPNDEYPNNELILQYVFVIDLEGLSMQAVNLKILTWFMKEVVPHYPGMLAAVLLLNYSWTYARVWTVARCLLPHSAIARVFFPSREELLHYCSASALPSNYGGALPPLDRLVMNPAYQTNGASVGSGDECMMPMPMPVASVVQKRIPETLQIADWQGSDILIPPRSSVNPFFGYPTHVGLSSPHVVRQGRRRRRDLLLTLSVLWWRRWGSRLITLLCLLVGVALTRKRVGKIARWILLSGRWFSDLLINR